MAIRINVRRSANQHVVRGETQGGHAGRAWRIRLADTRGYSRKTKRCEFRPVALTETNRSEVTFVGSLLRYVHTLQIKLRGCPRRQALRRCASIQIRPGWLRSESRECGMQFFCETWNSDPIHHVHTHIQTHVSPWVSESPLSVVQERHYWGTCTQEVQNIISLEERSRDSTIEIFWGNNKLACKLNYWLVRWERHERHDGCGGIHEYVIWGSHICCSRIHDVHMPDNIK